MIYLDYAATTQCKKEVQKVMEKYENDYYGNPSSQYPLGKHAKKGIQKAREQIAQLIHCKSSDIYFTSGGTEADNWVFYHTYFKKKGKPHIVASKIEHPAVLKTLEFLQAQGANISYLDVDHTGKVSLEQLEEYLIQGVDLVTVMFANNEIGTIQQVERIAQMTHFYKSLFHTDAVQALGHIPIDVSKLSIDYLSGSSHKIYGPKGVGMLYVRNSTDYTPLIYGGGQENGMRSGTENVPGIVGFGEATAIANKNLLRYQNTVVKMRNYIMDRILREISKVQVTGDLYYRLPGNASFCFYGIEGGELVQYLAQKEICVSSGSACSAGKPKTSHVLEAIGLPKEWAKGALRISLSDQTTREDLEIAVKEIIQGVNYLRAKGKYYS